MLRCGTGLRVITPEGPAYLMGYAARRGKATDGAVHDDLFARALYFERDGARALLISCDLTEFALRDATRLRARIAERTGVENVLFAVTHTHSGPGTFFHPIEMPNFNEAWFAWACDEIVEAAADALVHPFEARVACDVTDAPEVGKNRRKPGGVTDPALSVLRVDDMQGVTRAIVLNYACHCTILDGNSYTVSADYPGYLYLQIAERYPDALTLFTNGAAGDINIGYSADASALGEAMDFRSFETAERMARILSDKAIHILEGIIPEPDAPLAFHTATVRYPLRRDAPDDAAFADTIAGLEAFCASDAPEAERRAAQIRLIYAQILRESMASLGRAAWVEADSCLLRVGNALFVSFPVELFCEVGLALKARLPQRLLAVPVGYAGGYIGYLPTEAAMREGGYESETSPFAPDAEKALVEQIADAANRMILD